MPKSLTLTIDSRKALPLVCDMLLKKPLTEREISILRVILKNKYHTVNLDNRSTIEKELKISRFNLNNNLGRMQLKGVFSIEWHLNKRIAELGNNIDCIVLELK